MADEHKPCELSGWRIEYSRDTVKKAYVVAILENYRNSDKVEALPPKNESDGNMLILVINGNQTDRIQLPAIIKGCEVKPAKKDDSTWHFPIKLEKKVLERWVKWPSPPLKRATVASTPSPAASASATVGSAVEGGTSRDVSSCSGAAKTITTISSRCKKEDEDSGGSSDSSEDKMDNDNS